MAEALQPTILEPVPAEISPQLEDLDYALFGELQRDGRAAFTTVAARLEVSEAQVRRRFKALVDADVFAIAPIANPRVLGLDQLACMGLVVRGPYMATVIERLLAMPEVSFLVVTSGEFNLIVEVGCVSSDELYEFVLNLRRLPGRDEQRDVRVPERAAPALPMDARRRARLDHEWPRRRDRAVRGDRCA